MHNTEKLSHEVATRNFAPSFTIEFLSIFMHTSDATMPITLIWVSLERSFPPAEREYRCQFWSKVMMSENETKSNAHHCLLQPAQESMG